MERVLIVEDDENIRQFKEVKNLLVKIMSIVADTLSSKWDDSRYSRDIDE